jgi:hypothetical protein
MDSFYERVGGEKLALRFTAANNRGIIAYALNNIGVAGASTAGNFLNKPKLTEFF